MSRSKAVAMAAYVVLAGALLGGCGSEQTASDDAGEPSSTAPPATDAPTPTPTPAPSEDLPEDLPTGPPGKGSAQVSGTVTAGVEAGCYLLTSGGSTYQLIWEQGDLVAGEQVKVSGTVERDRMTTCQQGIPFVVQRLQVSPDQPQ